MTLNNTDPDSNGVSIVSGSRITFAQTGVYDIEFSAQFHNTGGGGAGNTVQLWLRKNGTDLTYTNTIVTVPSNAPFVVAAWNFVESITATEYYELIWSTDNTNIVMEYVPAAAPAPAAPRARRPWMATECSP